MSKKKIIFNQHKKYDIFLEIVFINFFLKNNSISREIIESPGGPHHLSTIPLKNFHMFKIVESVINFSFKKISN